MSVGAVVVSPVPLPPGVRLVRGRWIPWIGGLLAGGLSGDRRPAAAVTLGSTIIVHASVVPTASLVQHELEHVRQWRAEGWAFPVRYAIQYLRYGYRANPYEQAARDAEHNTS